MPTNTRLIQGIANHCFKASGLQIRWNRGTPIDGSYNWETNQIKISNLSLSKDYGYAKSSYLHELNHRNDMQKHIIDLIINKYLRNLDGYEYKKAAINWHKQFYAQCDVRSYALELNNVSKFGLSLSQYNDIFSNYRYFSSISGYNVPISKYTLWTFIKSILLP